MPSKQSLLTSYFSSGQILEFAHAQHGVKTVLNFVKQLDSGSFLVEACMDNNPADVFQGEGATKLEAIADCIAMRFPA